MAKYLNESGLRVLWGNIKNYFPSVKHAVDGTATLNDGIADGNLATFTLDNNNNVSLQGIALTALPVNSHAHGNITNAGAITAAGVDIASGDALVITDSSASGKLVKSDITFDGSTTSQFLTKKGDWGTALTSHQSLGLIIGNSATAVTEASSTANTTTFLNLLGDGALKDSVQVTGTNNISVTGAAGKITISGLENTVTGSGLTADAIVLGNGNSGIKTSSKTITVTLGSDDTTVPTSKAVATAISNATSGLSGAMHFIGSTTTALSDGATTATLEGSSLTKTTGFVSGDVVLSGSKEFVWTGSAWELLGDEGSYALKTVTITGSGALGGGGTLASNRTITHNTSGVTSGTYGPTAAVSGANSIAVPKITVNEYGHITAVETFNYTGSAVGSGKLQVVSNSATTGIDTSFTADSGSNTIGLNFINGTHTTAVVTAVSGKAPTITFNHNSAGSGTVTTTTNGTASDASAGTSYDVLTGVTVTRDSLGHVTGVSTTRQKVVSNQTVNNGTMQISANSGNAVNTLFTANGSTANAIKFVNGTGNTVTVTAASGTTTPATVTITNDHTKTSPTAVTAYPSGTTVSANGGTIKVRDIQFNSDGHVTASQERTITLSQVNTAQLKISDTSNKKISTEESSSKYIQFTGGTNKFTVTDGTSSFDVSVANGMEEITDAEINTICVL